MGDNKIIFNNNEGIGGFEQGAYDSFARQPIDSNWTRQSQFKIPNKPKHRWKVVMKDSFVTYQSFVVDRNQNIIIADCDNNILGADNFGRIIQVSKQGIVTELFKTNRRLKMPVIGSDGLIYVTTTDSMDSQGFKLLCITPNGTLKWEYPINQEAYSKTVFDKEGNIYIFTYSYDEMHGYFLSINKDGILNWKIKMKSINWYDPIISIEGIIYVGLNVPKTLCAFDKNGNKLWEHKVGQGLGNNPFIIKNDGTIYANLSDGFLYAFDLNAQIKWRYSPGDRIVVTTPALGNDGCLYLNLGGNVIAKLNKNGEEMWRSNISCTTNIPPIIDRNNQFYHQSYIDSYPINQSWIDAFTSDGEKLWTYEMQGTIISTVLADDNLIYALCNVFTSTRRGRPDKEIVDWELNAIGNSSEVNI